MSRQSPINLIPVDVFDFKTTPDTWNCIDCGWNTAHLAATRGELEKKANAVKKRGSD